MESGEGWGRGPEVRGNKRPKDIEKRHYNEVQSNERATYSYTMRTSGKRPGEEHVSRGSKKVPPEDVEGQDSTGAKLARSGRRKIYNNDE